LKHRSRKLPRLPGYDYSTPGYYFITICIKNSEILLGKIEQKQSHLNAIGRIAENIWKAIPEYYPHARLDEFVFMPDHMHAIIEILPASGTDAINRVRTGGVRTGGAGGAGGATGKLNPMLNPESLSNIIRWYKGRSTFEIHKIENGKFFKWHGRFHDRIIRSNIELNRIRYYIQQNPVRWKNREEENAA